MKQATQEENKTSLRKAKERKIKAKSNEYENRKW